MKHIFLILACALALVSGPAFAAKNQYPVTITASTTSAAIDLYDKGYPVAIITPASLGATAITFTAALTSGGTYLPVKNEAGNSITVVVDTSSAGWYDLTNIFPSSVRFIKVVANASITKNLTLVTRDER